MQGRNRTPFTSFICRTYCFPNRHINYSYILNITKMSSNSFIDWIIFSQYRTLKYNFKWPWFETNMCLWRLHESRGFFSKINDNTWGICFKHLILLPIPNIIITNVVWAGNVFISRNRNCLFQSAVNQFTAYSVSVSWTRGHNTDSVWRQNNVLGNLHIIQCN